VKSVKSIGVRTGNWLSLRQAQALPFGSPDAHRGLIAADLDSDGRLDLVVTALGSKAEIWKNRAGGEHHWIAFDVPPGAEVRVGAQVAWASSTAGYASSVLAPLHFGLGNAQIAPPVEITWPDRRKTHMTGLSVDQVVHPLRP